MDHPESPITSARLPTMRLLVTAGPTHEPIDSVRYLANRSSGRMGMAIAHAAAARGTPCTLLLGPTPLLPPTHSHISTLRFQSTADLQVLLAAHWPLADILIMAAAVADYRPANPPQVGKIHRNPGNLTLELESTPDLLAAAALHKRQNQSVVGFALEPPDRLLQSAREKLKRKSLDVIVANPLQTMDSPLVHATVLFADPSAENPRVVSLPPTSKDLFATWLLDQALPFAAAKMST